MAASIGFEPPEFGSYSSTSRSMPGSSGCRMARLSGNGSQTVAPLIVFCRHGNEWDDIKAVFSSEETYIWDASHACQL